MYYQLVARCFYWY